MGWLIWLPLLVLGVVLVLFLLLLLLARIQDGRFLRPIVNTLAKVGFMRRLFQRLSVRQIERDNPELASAIRKMQAFGIPETPQQAEIAMRRLTPGERKAYLAAAGEQGAIPEPTNRAERRRVEKIQQPAGSSRPGARGRKGGGKGKRGKR